MIIQLPDHGNFEAAHMAGLSLNGGQGIKKGAVIVKTTFDISIGTLPFELSFGTDPKQEKLSLRIWEFCETKMETQSKFSI